MMSNLVHNERTKLISMFWNNVGVGAIVAGVVLPSLSGEASVLKFIAGMVTGFTFGLTLSWIAYWNLGFLKDE